MKSEIIKWAIVVAISGLVYGLATAAPIESAPISIDLTPRAPEKSEWERSQERAAERDKALKVKESRRLAAKANRRRYLLNEAAANIKVAASLTGNATRAEIDFKTGDILISFDDGQKFLQRFDEKALKGKQIYRKANGKRRPLKKKGGE